MLPGSLLLETGRGSAPPPQSTPAEATPLTPWRARFAQRTRHMSSSVIRELLKLTERPEIISFAGGLPAPEVFPLEQIEAATRRVLAEHGAQALQYSATEGYTPLRELLVRHMQRYGVHVTPANILITGGSQQALDLLARLFVNPGDRVLTEEPSYLGALQAFQSAQAEFVGVPIDDEGMDVDALEGPLRTGPKFMYVLPNFQNPAGVTLSLARRRRLLQLAGHYGIPIIEDDPYGQLRYAGEHIPPLVKIDADLHGGAAGRAFTGNVLYVSTLSKVLAPGLRLAWVVAPEVVIERLVQFKQATDLHTATFTQMVAYEVARGGFLDQHVRRVRAVYGARRDAMLEALGRHFPDEARWTRPEGGLFLWVTLPKGVDTSVLLDHALAQQVAFVPGAPFHPCGGGHETLRLNFSYPTPERIEEGVRRLGRVLEQACRQRSA
jgi:2-aminoadipate transaminase